MTTLIKSLFLQLLGFLFLNHHQTIATNSVISLQYKEVTSSGEGVDSSTSSSNNSWLIHDFNYANRMRKFSLIPTSVDYFSSVRKGNISLAPSVEAVDEVDISLSYFLDNIQEKLMTALSRYKKHWKEMLHKQTMQQQEIDKKYQINHLHDMLQQETEDENRKNASISSATALLHSFYEKWKIADEISIERPLIFFHQRKAGGSSIRITMHFASLMLGLPSHISCWTKPCDAYHVEYDDPYAIYAGHYPWGSQNRLAKFAKSMRSSHFQCVTNYRHPIDRIESCLYFRFPDILTNRCLNDLTLSELKALLFTMDDYGNSCLNEIFRMLSGESNEILIDHMMNERVDQLLLDESDREEELFKVFETADLRMRMRNRNRRQRQRRLLKTHQQGKKNKHGEAVAEHGFSLQQKLPYNQTMVITKNNSSRYHHSDFPDDSEHSQRQSLHGHVIEIFEQTLLHAQKCLPLVLEIPETYNWIAAKFPTLGAFGGFNSDMKAMSGDHSRCSRLEGEKVALVQRLAALELLVYHAVYNRTREEIEIFHQDRERYIEMNKKVEEMTRRNLIVNPLEKQQQQKENMKQTSIMMRNDKQQCNICYEGMQIEKRVPFAYDYPNMLHENGASRVAFVQTGGMRAHFMRWMLESMTGLLSNSHAIQRYLLPLFFHDQLCTTSLSTTTAGDNSKDLTSAQDGALFVVVEPSMFRYFERQFQHQYQVSVAREARPLPTQIMTRKQTVLPPLPATNVSFYAIPVINPPWAEKEHCPNVQGDRFEKALVIAKDPFVFLWQVLWGKKAVDIQFSIPSLQTRGKRIQDWFASATTATIEDETKKTDTVSNNHISMQQFLEVQHYLNELLTITWIAPNTSTNAQLSHKERLKLYHLRHFMTHFHLSSDSSSPAKTWREWIESSIYSYYFGLFFDRHIFHSLFDNSIVRLIQSYAEYAATPLFEEVKAGKRGKSLLPIDPMAILGLDRTKMMHESNDSSTSSIFSFPPPLPFRTMKNGHRDINIPLIKPGHFFFLSPEALLDSIHTLKQASVEATDSAWQVIHRISDFLGYPSHELDLCRIRCASDLLLFPEKFKMEEEIQQVKSFYQANPSKLQFTRQFIRYILKEIDFDPKMFQFIFEL